MIKVKKTTGELQNTATLEEAECRNTLEGTCSFTPDGNMEVKYYKKYRKYTFSV